MGREACDLLMPAPIQPDAHGPMNKLARDIDRGLNGRSKVKPKRYGFILLVAEFGKIEDGRVNYISNGEREDMIAMMREYLARVEGQYHDGPSTPQ